MNIAEAIGVSLAVAAVLYFVGHIVGKEKVRTKEKNSGGKSKFVVCFLHKGCIPFQGFYSDFVKSKCRCKKSLFRKIEKQNGPDGRLLW